MDAELVNAQIGVPGPYRIRLSRHVDESLLYQVYGPGLVDEGWTSLMHRAVCAARQYNNVWNAAQVRGGRGRSGGKTPALPPGPAPAPALM